MRVQIRQGTYVAPALKAIGVKGVHPHNFRRTFIALHVEVDAS